MIFWNVILFFSFMHPFRRDSVDRTQQHSHSPPTTRSHRTYSDTTTRSSSFTSLLPFLGPKGHKHSHPSNTKDNSSTNSNNNDTPRRSLDVRSGGGLVITETSIQPVVNGMRKEEEDSEQEERGRREA